MVAIFYIIKTIGFHSSMKNLQFLSTSITPNRGPARNPVNISLFALGKYLFQWRELMTVLPFSSSRSPNAFRLLDKINFLQCL